MTGAPLACPREKRRRHAYCCDTCASAPLQVLHHVTTGGVAQKTRGNVLSRVRAAMDRRSPPLLNQETTPGGGAFKHNQSFRHGPGACACAQARFDSFSYLIRAPVRSNHRDIQRLSRAAPMANTTDDAPPPPLFQSVLSHRVHSSARVPSIHPTFLRLLRPVIPSIDPCVQIKKGYPTLNNRPATTLCS
jgi:hypothetical protein